MEMTHQDGASAPATEAARPTPARPDALTIELRRPVTFSETYSRLHLREPTVAQMIHWSERAGVEGDIRAVSAVAELPEGAVRQIGARDFLAAVRFIHSFAVAPGGEQSSDTKTIVLREAIEWEGSVYATIELREPLASELIEWDRSVGIVGDAKMVASLAGAPEPVVRRMRVGQFVEAAAYLSAFFDASRPDGDAS